MDVIFDIDGTLADATHRLHFIIPPLDQPEHASFKKDWDSFLSDEQVFKDAPIKPVWRMLDLIISSNRPGIDLRPGHDRILFITGRPQETYEMTREWLVMHAKSLTCRPELVAQAPIYMRQDGDKRPSHIVKREGLERAWLDLYDPQLVFEDRMDDAAMWREAGLICAQVAYGDY